VDSGYFEQMHRAMVESACKRRKLSPDLAVFLEDGVLEVHNVVIQCASSALAEMVDQEELTVNRYSMQADAVEHSLKLPGKTKSEFLTFYKSLMIHTQEDMSLKNCPLLARWAHEFGVENLRRRCDAFMMTLPVDTFGLQHALESRLENRTRQCLEHMMVNLEQYINDMRILIDYPEVLKEHWPCICEKAGLSFALALPSPPHLEMTWCFVAAAVRATARAERLEKLLGSYVL